jgi:SIR2-like domain
MKDSRGRDRRQSVNYFAHLAHGAGGLSPRLSHLFDRRLKRLDASRPVASLVRCGYDRRVLCDTVDIDEKLFAAQDDRKLVVFAGAGVSMGAPSNLPSFESLVKQIADGPLEPYGYPKRNFDYMLGQMKFKGIDVHDQCRRIITNPLSQPNELHAAILGLFPNPQDVRIITTNFDPHFLNSPVAQGKQIPVFYGPALPLGHDFRGIVHLHGSIIEPPRMILTDENFGAAYMTDGWVARFLREVFSTYTVAFIGYSHDDPAMNYFNLGLGGRRRQHFILTHADLPEWDRLHLTPLLYKTENQDRDHSKLTAAVKAWAHESSMRPSEVDVRLQQILSKPPAEVQYEEDFIRRHYSRKQSSHSFTGHAQLFEWISWMDKQGMIRPLLLEFQSRGAEEAEEEYETQRNVHGSLSFWLGRTLARDASGVGISIVEECGGTLNFNAARGILIELLNVWEKAAVTDATIPTLSQKRWLFLLLRQSPATYFGLHARTVDLLGKRDQWSAALRVVAYLVSSSIRKPRPNDLDGIIGRGPAPALVGEHYDLTQALEGIKLQAGQQPQRQAELMAVLELACLDLGELFEIVGRNNHHHSDLVPFESILNQTETGSDSIRLLVRSTCLIALEMARAGKVGRNDFIRWLDSKNQILVRCALLCMRHSPLPPSELLDVLINHNGIYSLAFRANIERAEFVNAIYDQLTEAEREAYWQAVYAGPSAEWEEGAPRDQS